MSYRGLPLFFLIAWACSACPEPSEPSPDAPIATFDCSACDGDCLIEQFAALSASHIEGGLDYSNRPPTSGDHDPCWADYGVHTEELGDEHWVHNLEHGAVVFLYDCPGGCAEDVATLESIVAESPTDTTILTSYAGMDTPFAAVSWGWRITLGCADDAELRAFYSAHAGQAPEDTTSAPPGGCTE